MRTLGQVILGVLGFSFVVWWNWMSISSDYTWYRTYEQAAHDTGARYKLIKVTSLEKPWTWFYPAVETVTFFRQTEMIDTRATFGIAGRVSRVGGQELYYVYIDCDEKIVKEIDATNLSDEESTREIYSTINLQFKEGRWKPKAPFVISRRFYDDFCNGKAASYKSTKQVELEK